MFWIFLISTIKFCTQSLLTYENSIEKEDRLNFTLFLSDIPILKIRSIDYLHQKAISDRRFPVSKLIGAWCSLIRERGKRVVKGKWTEEKEARSQMTGWLFNLAGLYFFLSRESRWKIASATMIDALADTWRREQRRKGRIRVCICIYIFYIYIFLMRYRLETQRQIHIKIITTIRHTGKAHTREWDTDIQGFGWYIHHTGSIRLASPYSVALHRDGFLMGCNKNQDWLN